MNTQNYLLLRGVAIASLTLAFLFADNAEGFQARGVDVNVKVSQLFCLEETNEAGADEPYIVSLAVNLRTGQTTVASDLFIDVDQGESRQPDLEIGHWINVQRPDEVMILLMMVETNQSVTGRIGTKHYNVGAKAILERGRVPKLIQDLRQAYPNGGVNRVSLESHLFQSMVAAMKPGERNHDDEFLEIHELRLSQSDLSPDMPRTFLKQIEFRGDGGRYLVTCQVTSGPTYQSKKSGSGVRSTGNVSTGLSVNGTLGPPPVKGGSNGSGSSGNDQNQWPGNQPGNSGGSNGGSGGGSSNGSQNTWPGGGSNNNWPGGGSKNNWPGGGQNSGSGEAPAGYCPLGNGKSNPSNNSFPGNTGSGQQNFNLQGTWNSNIGITYRIQQTGSSFTWTADILKQKAHGSISGNRVQAQWSDPMGSDSGTAEIKFDASGRAHRIEWQNGVVFHR